MYIQVIDRNLKRIFMNVMSKGFGMIVLSIMLTSILPSCNSDVGENFYTFKDEMMGGHLKNNPELYSEFTKMLDTTGVLGLLNAYGDYTCFAPTNDAVFEFYASTGRSSLEEFPYDTIVKVVYDHIIKDTEVESSDFIEGRLPYLTMSNRYISVIIEAQESDTALSYIVNKTSRILDLDYPVHNGIVHRINEVLKPTEKSLVEALTSDPKFTLFTKALIATGLNNELSLTEDKSYDINALDEDELSGTEIYPEQRKYGYTAFVESDETFAAAGYTTLVELEAYAKEIYDVVYPQDAGLYDGKENYFNRKSPLNRFIAYHLVNKQMSKSKLIKDYDTDHMLKNHDMYEYIETLCPNTLIEVKIDRTSSRDNLINYLSEDNYVALDDENFDNDAINGVYHEINKILTYNIDVISDLSSKRLRLEAASFFPEFTNNNMRGNGVVERYLIPEGYLDRLTLSEGTKFFYLNADDRYLDFQGDEIFLTGLYDFEITTPSIPAGTYEVRMGYQPTLNRGKAQLYIDSIPCGIPLDLTLDADYPTIGYEKPGTNSSDPLGYENDKMMRNRGYMKGPNSYKCVDTSTGWGYDGANSRLSSRYLRKVLGIYSWNEAGEHKFKVKAARRGEFMLDYLEFVPVELIEREGVD